MSKLTAEQVAMVEAKLGGTRFDALKELVALLGGTVDRSKAGNVAEILRIAGGELTDEQMLVLDEVCDGAILTSGVSEATEPVEVEESAVIEEPAAEPQQQTFQGMTQEPGLTEQVTAALAAGPAAPEQTSEQPAATQATETAKPKLTALEADALPDEVLVAGPQEQYGWHKCLVAEGEKTTWFVYRHRAGLRYLHQGKTLKGDLMAALKRKGWATNECGVQKLTERGVKVLEAMEAEAKKAEQPK